MEAFGPIYFSLFDAVSGFNQVRNTDRAKRVLAILAASGSSLHEVLDVQVFLVDMDRDFAAFNAVYKKHFESVGATRTTVSITALPTPIAVEFKILASAK